MSIVENDKVDAFIENIGAEYERLTGRKASFYQTGITDGAGRFFGENA